MGGVPVAVRVEVTLAVPVDVEGGEVPTVATAVGAVVRVTVGVVVAVGEPVAVASEVEVAVALGTTCSLGCGLG